MKTTDQLKVGDVIYQSNCTEWDDAILPSFENWHPTVVMELEGRLFLTGHASIDDSKKQDYVKTYVFKPEPNQRWGETPQEAVMIDATEQVIYHQNMLAMMHQILMNLKKLRPDLTTPAEAV